MPRVAWQATEHMIISSFMVFNMFDLGLCIFELSPLPDRYKLLGVKENGIYEYTAPYPQHLAHRMHFTDRY